MRSPSFRARTVTARMPPPPCGVATFWALRGISTGSGPSPTRGTGAPRGGAGPAPRGPPRDPGRGATADPRVRASPPRQGERFLERQHLHELQLRRDVVRPLAEAGGDAEAEGAVEAG